MPHVASQWNSGQHQRGSYDARLSTGKARKSTEYLRPIAIPPSRPGRQPRQSPNMSFLATPDTERWDFGSIRHIRQHSSETKTPVSAVDSVFELPSATSYNSPNSSTHSSFIAELEDTSPMALQTQKPSVQRSSIASPAVSHSSMEFKCAEMTVRLNLVHLSSQLTIPSHVQSSKWSMKQSRPSKKRIASCYQEQLQPKKQQINFESRTWSLNQRSNTTVIIIDQRQLHLNHQMGLDLITDHHQVPTPNSEHLKRR